MIFSKSKLQIFLKIENDLIAISKFYMDKVGVVGSGRWARVLITILDDILPPDGLSSKFFQTKDQKQLSQIGWP